jgi:hypothetical protein
MPEDETEDESRKRRRAQMDEWRIMMLREAEEKKFRDEQEAIRNAPKTPVGKFLRSAGSFILVCIFGLYVLLTFGGAVIGILEVFDLFLRCACGLAR